MQKMTKKPWFVGLLSLVLVCVFAVPTVHAQEVEAPTITLEGQVLEVFSNTENNALWAVEAKTNKDVFYYDVKSGDNTVVEKTAYTSGTLLIDLSGKLDDGKLGNATYQINFYTNMRQTEAVETATLYQIVADLGSSSTVYANGVLTGNSDSYTVNSTCYYGDQDYDLDGSAEVEITAGTSTYAVDYKAHVATGDGAAESYSATLAYKVGEDTLMSVPVSYAVGTYTYQLPSHFALNGVYYELNQDSNVVTLTKENDKETINVVYKEFDRNSAYNWTIRMLDAYTGEQIATDITREVGVDQTETYDTLSSITSNGTTYTIDESMPTSFSHTYGDAQRITYVYYNPEGYTPNQGYSITVQYMNITTNQMIYSTSMAVNMNDDTTVSTPEQYEANGNTYVRLRGQESDIRHSYYSPNRTYTIYYRDINDTINADATVTVITNTVIDYVDVVDGGTTTTGTTAGVAATTAQTPATAITNETTDTTQILDEEGNVVEPQRIEDEEVPMASADGVESADGEAPLGAMAQLANNPVAWGVGVVVLVMLIGAALYFVNRSVKNRRGGE